MDDILSRIRQMIYSGDDVSARDGSGSVSHHTEPRGDNHVVDLNRPIEDSTECIKDSTSCTSKCPKEFKDNVSPFELTEDALQRSFGCSEENESKTPRDNLQTHKTNLDQDFADVVPLHSHHSDDKHLDREKIVHDAEEVRKKSSAAGGLDPKVVEKSMNAVEFLVKELEAGHNKGSCEKANPNRTVKEFIAELLKPMVSTWLDENLKLVNGSNVRHFSNHHTAALDTEVGEFFCGILESVIGEWVRNNLPDIVTKFVSCSVDGWLNENLPNLVADLVERKINHITSKYGAA